MNHARVPESPDGNTRCPECGAVFTCGIAAGEDRCWCMELPYLAGEMIGDGACLCPECLQRALEHTGKPK
ncbi:cysteine-rich CWC family protein [bacterium]|nr:cysteine-rich CWC family protein [bacterium]